MSNIRLQIPNLYRPLFMPNHSPEEARMYDSQEYRNGLITKLMAGEKVNASEFGAKTFIGRSGRSTGKTTNNEYAIGLDITQGRGDVWYCRSEQSDIRNSIFTSMQSTLRNLGYSLSNNNSTDFRVSHSPYEITHNATGNKIQFLAINKDINRTKGYVPPSGKLKRIVLEEANEVDNESYIVALESTAVKFIDSNSKFVYNMNPPETRRHWSAAYFDQKVREGATLIYTTWEYLAKLGMLSAAAVGEIVKMRENNPLFYRYWYLGEIVNLTGLVFPQFDRDKHVIHSIDPKRVAGITSRYIVAGDAANKNDPTCFAVLCELSKDNVGALLVLDAMYYDPRINGQIDDVELARKVCDWWQRVINKYPNLNLRNGMGTVDNANWNLMRMLERSRALGRIPWYPATNKSILRDVNRLRVLFRENMIIFHDAPDNDVKEIVRELENFVYDEKTGEIKKNQDDHGIDMLKYGTLLVNGNMEEFF